MSIYKLTKVAQLVSHGVQFQSRFPYVKVSAPPTTPCQKKQDRVGRNKDELSKKVVKVIKRKEWQFTLTESQLRKMRNVYVGQVSLQYNFTEFKIQRERAFDLTQRERKKPCLQLGTAVLIRRRIFG